jgi:hypothetical protein
MNDVSVPAPTCARCRTTRRDGRLTLRGVAQRLREEVLGWERGLLPTAGDLMLRPQVVVDAFLRDGNSRYYGPFKYFLIATAVSLLLMPDVPAFDRAFAALLGRQLFATPDAALRWVQDWNVVIYAPLVLLLALAMRGFFRARDLNLAEHLAIVAYGWAQMLLIATVVFGCVTALHGIAWRSPWLALVLLAAPLYWFWFVARVLRIRHVADWVRALAALPGALAMFFLLSFVLVAAAAGVLAIIGPRLGG